MRVAVFGASGQVGSRLLETLDHRNTVFPDRGQVDLSYPGAALTWICRNRPRIIVNCAGYTAVDRAELEPGLAHQLNTDAAAEIALAAKQIDAFLIHLSTDYVFDGARRSPYREGDAPAPLNVYGKSKLGGEQKVRESGCRFLIARAAWVYDCRGTNFLTKIRARLDDPVIRVVNDQTGSPTSAPFLAKCLSKIIAALDAPDTVAPDLVHIASRGPVSRYDFAKALIDAFRPYPLERPTLVPIGSGDLLGARRPPFSALDGSFGEHRFGLKPVHWQDDLRQLLSPNH